jgi:hypothetical protein
MGSTPIRVWWGRWPLLVKRVVGASHRCEAWPWAPGSFGCCVWGQLVGSAPFVISKPED